jgi:cell division protein FtsQ
MTLVRRVSYLCATLALVAVGWSGYLWARDLSLFRIRHVEISGLSSREAPAIRRALRETASRMTALHVRERELREAVDSFPVVRSLSASSDFPNTLKIKVNEYVPVAALETPSGRRVAVSSADTLLRGLGPKTKLPVVKTDAIPTSGKLTDAAAGRLVRALAAAPPELRSSLARAYASKDGIRVTLTNEQIIRLGDGTRLAAKWAAAASVLADPSSRGAGTIDVRVPQRPAAGRGAVEEPAT